MSENNYLDETILEMKRQKYKEENKNIKEGVYIKNEYVEFEKVKLFNNAMSILLSKNFIDLPENMKKIKYPSEDRPQIIKTSLDTSVNFGFSLMPLPIKNEQTKDAITQFKILLKKVNPAYIFYDLKSEKIGEKTISWFDFKSYGLDFPMYNIMYILPIRNKVMHGIFNCLYEDVNEWKEYAFQVIKTIEENFE
ncbi:hypothetical protein [[Clostridium] colinum]|uniref:hypothetical protein n=1 Tax=[Clostridium] colinum TaxID=36835 RepID=UPI002023E1AC|nr:hypothetical protein [[Clostridium] colinum]